MGTTVTFVYPIDPEAKLEQTGIERLKAIPDLASFLGFPRNPLFLPKAEVREGHDVYYGEGMDDRDPIIRDFAIVIENALRPDEDLKEPHYESRVTDEIMNRLEATLGVKLGQDTFMR